MRKDYKKNGKRSAYRCYDFITKYVSFMNEIELIK